MNESIPPKQTAIQLVGPDQLVLNREKIVPTPGPYQVLCRVEAVGLCFSDLKLLKQFSGHARKSEVLTGMDQVTLKEIPSYVPAQAPTVLGHEASVRVAATGKKVKNIKLGQRYLVQTDYRWLPTADSNAAFGYNFEGALQEYVLMDQRVITSPEGESMLLPADDELSAASVALVEPWACVEDAYAVQERTKLAAGGKMLIVADSKIPQEFGRFLTEFGKPGQITLIAPSNEKLIDIAIPVAGGREIDKLVDATFDDVIYFGSDKQKVEQLFGKIAANGLFNIVLGGKRLGGNVSVPVGRVHYGNIRLIGTRGSDPAESMRYIPRTGEIRPGEVINVIGAAGPMGMMHVIRNICQGVENITLYAGDLDDERLAYLNQIAQPWAKQNQVKFQPYNPAKADHGANTFSYIILMAPIPTLVGQAIQQSTTGGIINVFAGIPATVRANINLNEYLEKQLYFIGTSGSVLEDMKVVLAKVESGQLDPNISVGAVSGLDGAIDGIRAVEKHQIPGKIIVYPACKNLPLTTLSQLPEKSLKAASYLKNGIWTKKAEDALLSQYKN